MSTAIPELARARLWIVEDGETHWVVARTADEAIAIVQESFGHGDEYRAEYEPRATWAPFNKAVRINVTDNVRFYHNDYPPGTQAFVELMPEKIAKHMSGVVCSSVW